MKIYIASSWKNQHAVEMLTAMLREKGHTVFSFIEVGRCEKNICNIDGWIASDDGRAKFEYDTHAATKSNLVIYISPSGPDAWAEVGAAWASGVGVFGLRAKGEQIGLMRRMVAKWFEDYKELLEWFDVYELSKKKGNEICQN